MMIAFAMRKVAQGLGNHLRRMAVVVLFFTFAMFGMFVFGTEQNAAVVVEKSGEAFVVDLTMDVQVSPEVAWEVLTDYDHKTAIFANLTSSKVTSRDGNTWVVWQRGAAKFGPLSFPFESEREVRLEPMKRIRTRNLSGTLKSMESEWKISPLNQGVQIKYHADIVPDSLLVRTFGAFYVQHEVEKQLMEMAKEMMRRRSNADTKGIVLKLRQ